ncbi:MAG: hypothetical protein ACJA1A_002606 [Saprospiraceae bacterium]|jgi:hypothetical protein
MSNVSTVNMPFTDSVLPVKLIFFRGHSTSSGNILEWRTAVETNSDFFSIEKQTTSGNYVEIGTVMSLGNTTQSVGYSFIDTELIDKAYYRLVQVDIDGKTEISSIILVESKIDKTIKIYPTIASDFINVEILAHDDYKREYQILNIKGNVIKQEQLAYNQQLDISMLVNGAYFIMVMTRSDQYEILRFIKS